MKDTKGYINYTIVLPVPLVMIVIMMMIMIMISDSNWTEWSTIQGVIVQLILKWDGREARGRFEITSRITPRIVRYEVQLLINRIYKKCR